MTEQELVKLVENVPGHLGTGEAWFLYQLACMSTQSYVVEVGALQGRSAIAFAASGKTVLSVDLWMENMISDSKNAVCASLAAYLYNVTSRGFYNIVPYKMSSFQAEGIIPAYWELGVIFIDGAHDYPSVKFDISVWEHRLHSGSWFVFHDYTNPCGVKQAVDEWVVLNKHRIEEQLSAFSIIAFRIK